jgi:hypothetical protein
VVTSVDEYFWILKWTFIIIESNVRKGKSGVIYVKRAIGQDNGMLEGKLLKSICRKKAKCYCTRVESLS